MSVSLCLCLCICFWVYVCVSLSVSSSVCACVFVQGETLCRCVGHLIIFVLSFSCCTRQENMLQRFEDLSMAMGEADADLDTLLEEQAALQAKIDTADAWNLQVSQEHAVHMACCGACCIALACSSRKGKRQYSICRPLSCFTPRFLGDIVRSHGDYASFGSRLHPEIAATKFLYCGRNCSFLG